MKALAFGGGHGLKASLNALLLTGAQVGAVVVVSDDGGSSGRIRQSYPVLPPGDLRMAFETLSKDENWSHLLGHRFGGVSELTDHAVGNLILLALFEKYENPQQALKEFAYTYYNVIQYITIASTGNATDFGDKTVNVAYSGAFSNSTRGISGGGWNPRTNIIDYITIASTGNATDFGDLLAANSTLAGVAHSTRGVFGGGNTGSATNVMQYIEIASTGNATDFGDLTTSRNNLSACSNGHGGLQ